jgi:hypothetical protein
MTRRGAVGAATILVLITIIYTIGLGVYLHRIEKRENEQFGMCLHIPDEEQSGSGSPREDSASVMQSA